MRNQGSYYYAVVYAVSVLAFIVAAHPDVWADYARIGGLAGAVLVVVWVLEVAILHQLNWRAEGASRRGQPPRRVWGMGVAFLLGLSKIMQDVVEHIGGPIRPGALPVLVACLGTATYWLWPLRCQERAWRRRLLEQR